MFEGEDSPAGRFLEGFSNEVTALIAISITVVVSTLYFLYKQRNRLPQTIHPSLLPLVQEFRNIFIGGDHHPSQNAGMEEMRRTEPYNIDRTCPICFGAALFAVQTNCGHLFCVACLIGYWRHSASLLTPVKCAVCRTTVSMMMPVYSEMEMREQANARARAQADSDVNDYNRRFSGAPRPILDYIRDLPVLLPYLIHQLFSVDGLVWMFRVRVFFLLSVVILYVLSPFDILPEAVFGLIGVLDDLLIAIVLLLYATVLLRHFMAQRGGENGPTAPPHED